jgi:DNA-binding Xre family transcriptional regulator
MLSFSLTRVASLRGIGKPYKFLVKNGFTPTTATKLANGDIEFLRVDYLEKLSTLLNCTPNDFFEWTPNSRSEDKGDHPLHGLKKSELVDLTSTLRGLSMDKIKELEALLSEGK